MTRLVEESTKEMSETSSCGEIAKRGGQNRQGHTSLIVSADVVASIGSQGKVSQEMVCVGDGGGR